MSEKYFKKQPQLQPHSQIFLMLANQTTIVGILIEIFLFFLFILD